MRIQLVHGNYQIVSTIGQEKHEIDDNQSTYIDEHFLERVYFMQRGSKTKNNKEKRAGCSTCEITYFKACIQ